MERRGHNPYATKMTIRRSAEATATSHACHTRVRWSLKGLSRDLALTVRPIRDCYVRGSTGSRNHGHNVCGAQAAGNWARGRDVSLHVLYRFPEGVRQR